MTAHHCSPCARFRIPFELQRMLRQLLRGNLFEHFTICLFFVKYAQHPTTMYARVTPAECPARSIRPMFLGHYATTGPQVTRTHARKQALLGLRRRLDETATRKTEQAVACCRCCVSLTPISRVGWRINLAIPRRSMTCIRAYATSWSR